MIKKTLFLLAMLLSVVGMQAGAQQINGRWTVYPTVGDGFSRVIEGKTRVYTLTGNTLSHYDLSDNERYVYNTDNGLSENGIISGITYNYAKGYLLVAYASGNIDLIYDDGTVVNMPEIRDAVLSGTHGINNVSFDGDRIYVATEFGFVIYNEARHEVVESGILNDNFAHAFHIGGNLVLHRFTAVNKDIYSSPDSELHTSIDKFKSMGGIYSPVVHKINDNTLIFWNGGAGGTKAFYRWNFSNEPDGTLNRSLDQHYGIEDLIGDLVESADGAFGATADKYLFFKSDGTVEAIAVPEALKGGKALAANSSKSVWVEIKGVLGRYDLSGATPRQLMTVTAPEGTTVGQPVHFRWTADGSKLYLSNTTATQIYSDPGDNMKYPVYTEVLENSKFTDVAVKNVERYAASGENPIPDLEYDAATGRLGAGLGIAIDPDDDNIYYQANNGIGIAMIKDNSIVAYSNKKNNPTPEYWWLNRTMGVDIDAEGNLWMCVGYTEDPDVPAIGILPAAKRSKLGTVKKSDWKTYNKSKIFGNDKSNCFNRDTRTLFCKKSNMKFFIAGSQEGGFVALNDNGTPLNTADDKIEFTNTVTDTEGNNIYILFNYDMAEDHNGAVWMSTDRGVFYITNPEDATNATTLRVKRPIVPRNDGTNFGDYLLETERVYTVAVDPSNRKWLGTYSSGAYLVSADGTRILAHYTAENSPLPSNWVYRITCDPNSNKVYFGTSNGLASFDSDSSPAADDYSEVYAYPNPVRPDYTGWITIAGLMDNSLVKIADMAGNVFYTARSEGGMVSWDGCDASGKRVKTGVYLVFASQNASGSSSGAVTKIMVVN